MGSFPPNLWGFHDLLGNVWEWVADCWHADYNGAPADGSAWPAESCRKHVNRGGGWGNNLRALRLSARDADPADSWSDGLGLRVARSLNAAELAHLAGVAPDSLPHARIAEREPPPGKPARGARPPRQRFSRPRPRGRRPRRRWSLRWRASASLSVHLIVKGEQNWSNVRQHTQGSTVQEYRFSTRLRSDGVLYDENLLDPDPGTLRLAAKQRYLARRGLLRLKELNGGRLPLTAEELATLSEKLAADVPNCARDVACGEETAERMAALQALRNNSAADLDEALATPADPAAAQWLYFGGYAGCPVQIRVDNETHIAGERAYNHARTHLVPWSLDRSAHGGGNAEDQAQLCQRYVATINVRTGEVDLENLFIPLTAGQHPSAPPQPRGGYAGRPADPAGGAALDQRQAAPQRGNRQLQRRPAGQRAFRRRLHRAGDLHREPASGAELELQEHSVAVWPPRRSALSCGPVEPSLQCASLQWYNPSWHTGLRRCASRVHGCPPASRRFRMSCSSPKPIPTRRDLRFNLPAQRVADWHEAGGRHFTCFLNTFSTVLPVGERFFIDSVRAVRDQVGDPELQKAVTAFIGQEAMHGREHEEYNAAWFAEADIARRFEGLVGEILDWVQRNLPPSMRLSATIALEHFTALLADQVLSNPELTAGAEPHYIDLWTWHALEETEHKAVAYDVWLKVMGRGPRAYALRAGGQLAATAIFWSLVLPTHLIALKQQGQLADLRGWRKFFRYTLGEVGLVRRLIPSWAAYFRPGFHPWDHDNSAYLEGIEDFAERVRGREMALAA